MNSYSEKSWSLILYQPHNHQITITTVCYLCICEVKTPLLKDDTWINDDAESVHTAQLLYFFMHRSIQCGSRSVFFVGKWLHHLLATLKLRLFPFKCDNRRCMSTQLRGGYLTQIQRAADRSVGSSVAWMPHAASIMTGCLYALCYTAPNPLPGFHNTKCIFSPACVSSPLPHPPSVGVMLSALPGGGGWIESRVLKLLYQ